MRRPEVVLLALIVLAGCTTPAGEVSTANLSLGDAGVAVVAREASGDPSNNTAPDVASSAPVVLPMPVRIPFAEPVALPMTAGFGGGEPNIAALPDGTLFVVAPTGPAETGVAQGGGYLWRSQDGGATWEMLRGPTGETPAAVFCSCDSDVVTSPDGWVYYSDWWISAFLGPGNYLVERSPDGGETWEAMPITTREALGNRVDRQWLVAGPDGFVGLFYSYFAVADIPPLGAILPEFDSGIHAVYSYDHGATWSDPVAVLSEGPWQIAHPRLVPDGTIPASGASEDRDAAGDALTIVIPYGYVPDAQEFWRDPSLVMLGVSTDGGMTWEHLEVAQAPEGFDNLWAVQADVDKSGAIHVAWAARVDDDIMATYVATSRDLGQTWTTPLALRAEGLNFLPWVATFGSSTVAVGWYGGNATGDPTEADDEWFAYVAQSVDGGETFVVHRVTDEPVKVGSLCPKGGACEGDRELLDYVSMVYDADGLLHYAFARSEEGNALTMVSNEVAEMTA